MDNPDATLPLPQLWQRRFQDARNNSSMWRDEARGSYGFYSGSEQWTYEEQNILDEQGKPALAFNRAGTIIDVVSGSEINNRQEVRFLPRSLTDSGRNEVLTGANKYFREQCDAEDEETEAFHDLLISGMGWTETRLDYETDLDGMITIGRIDPLEMYWDPTAQKANLSDRRWQMRVLAITRAEFEDNWPAKIGEVVDSARAFSTLDSEPTHQQTRQDYEVGGLGYDPETGMINVAQCQWYEMEHVARVVNPQSGAIEQIPWGKFSKIKKNMEEADIPFVKMRRRHYYQCFVAGGVVLEEGDCPTQNDFSFQCLTGKRDRNQRSWYGLVRPMRDPQRWANKWLSQILHILNTNPKGGVMIETTAVDDQEEVEDRWAASDSVIWLNEGGTGKVTPKPQTAMPQGFEKLTEFAINSMPYVTGVNFELLGLASRDQPGVLEHQRKQSGLTVLAVLFNSLRRYRKKQGRIMLEMIQKYVSDGRLIRIVGEEGAKYVPLAKQSGGVSYDTIVDDGPTSMNTKETVWTLFTQAGPFLAKMGVPLPPDILDYVPLPATLVERWKEHIRTVSKQPGPQANPADVAKAEHEKQKAGLEAQEHQVEMQAKVQDIQHKQQMNVLEAQQERQKLQGLAATAQVAFAKARAEQMKAGVVSIEAAREARQSDEMHDARLEKVKHPPQRKAD